MTAKINFIQLNQKKTFASAVELNNKLCGMKDFIVMSTEPYVKMGKIASAPPNTVVISYGENPRAAIITSKNLNILKLDNLSTKDCAVAILKTSNEQSVLASIYMDIKKAVDTPWLRNLFDYCNKKQLPLIICTDTNAHSSLYGNSTNKRGEELEDIIINNSLFVENVGLSPTLKAGSVVYHIGQL